MTVIFDDLLDPLLRLRLGRQIHKKLPILIEKHSSRNAFRLSFGFVEEHVRNKDLISDESAFS